VSAEPADGVYLQTAIDAVRRAGEIQRQASRGTFEIRKKGTIDLVTEVDVAVEKMVRALIAERYPDHDVLGEEFGGPGAGEGSRYCWICDPLDGTTNFAHGLPLFCSTIALEVDGELRVGAVYDPTREELFTAIRGGGAFLNGEPIRVSTAATLIDSLLVTASPIRCRRSSRRCSGCSAASSRRRVPCAGSGRPRSTCATSPPGGSTASGKRGSTPGTSPAAS
jgi:myo-inositol-1(or 4)-monophosphatase